MSASRMPTFEPEIAQAERQIDRGGRFADAAFAGGDRDHRIDPGNAGLHLVGGMGGAVRLRAGRRRLWRARRGTGGPLGGQRNQRRFHAGHGAHGVFGRARAPAPMP